MDIAKIRKKLKQGGTKKKQKAKEPEKEIPAQTAAVEADNVSQEVPDESRHVDIAFEDGLYDELEKDVPSVELLAFRVSGQEYALRVDEVQEILTYMPVTPVPGAVPFIRGIVSLRGTIIPVMDLAMRLLIKGRQEYGKKSRILIVHGQRGPIGVLLESGATVLAVPVDNFDTVPESLPEEETVYLESVARWDQRFIFLLKTVELFNFSVTLEAQ